MATLVVKSAVPSGANVILEGVYTSDEQQEYFVQWTSDAGLGAEQVLQDGLTAGQAAVRDQIRKNEAFALAEQLVSASISTEE